MRIVLIRTLHLLVAVIAMGFFATAFAEKPQPICQAFSAPLKGGFCVSIPHKPNGDILYQLHGKGGSEFNWFDNHHYGQQLTEVWQHSNAPQPIVVTISFGPIWLLAEKNASPYSGLFEAFIQMVLPKIENSLGGLKGRRILVGTSMGGVNSIQLTFKTEMFSKAAILCAPMAQVSPFASAAEIQVYAEATRAHNKHKADNPTLVFDTMMQAAELSRAFFPTPQDWLKGDAFSLVEKLPNKMAQLYMAVGVYDKYGAFEPNEALVKLLRENKVDVEWRPQYGDHCAIDILSLSKFILN